ncbi:SMI1/KNR4 family protein [Paenibacillus sp. 481]|uniref:SMI1/KNR4 family protein n=1 Tax=Paenibacillus sp. 481 TaxID=2835869 RepID=UPI001E5E619F|nr:SMI1/KNR4 family protein [Paenibacillus sp. 481]UHA73768.1 SMI1/KNR4 family protein [Paenibacillus sp. 481]
MNSEYRVTEIINRLKQRTALRESLLVPHILGELYVGQFTFEPPATKREMRGFTNRFKIQLADEYVEFLKCCNGAILFDIGEGMRTEIYGLRMLTTFISTISEYCPHFLPIASNPKANFFVDMTSQAGHVFWNDGSPNYVCLKMSFAEWLAHVVTASKSDNGSDFWNWSPRLQCRGIYDAVHSACMERKQY